MSLKYEVFKNINNSNSLVSSSIYDLCCDMNNNKDKYDNIINNLSILLASIEIAQDIGFINKNLNELVAQKKEELIKNSSIIKDYV